MHGSSCDRGRFMKKTFRFDTICNTTQEPQELHRLKCACGFSIADKTLYVLTENRISTNNMYQQLLNPRLTGPIFVTQLTKGVVTTSLRFSKNEPPYI